jgi:hypothetical protein
MRMQQSVKLSSGQGTKDSKDLYKGNPSKLGGTGTGTDFDLNNREPDIENVEDDDAPSDGIHDGDNTLDDDVTRQNIRPGSILDSQEESVKLGNHGGYYRPAQGIPNPLHHLHKERPMGATHNSSLMDQTVMTDLGVRINEGIQRDGERVAIFVDDHGGAATGGDSFVKAGGPAMGDASDRGNLSNRIGRLISQTATPSIAD